MSTITKGSSGPKKEKKQKWSKSFEKNGLTESITVKQVENGFIVCKERYGEDMSSKTPDKYISEREEYISNTNPLDGEEINEDFEELIKKFE